MPKPIYQDKLLYPSVLWSRPVHFYKAEAGKILVVAGSKGMTGAAILTCEAVFRSGTGILLLGFPESLKGIYRDILPEAMTLELPETPGHTLAKKAEQLIIENSSSCDVVIIGPGTSVNPETVHLIWELIFSIKKLIVLDADGLTALAKGIEVMLSRENLDYLRSYFTERKGKLVLTPHPGEAARILSAMKQDKKFTSRYVETHKEEAATLLAEALSCTVVLKGFDTTIATDDGKVIINRVGGPELATAGSGDVLSGMIGSFLGQNLDKPTEAIATAVYLHGLSGKLAKEEIGERGVMASDIIRYLSRAIKKAEEE